MISRTILRSVVVTAGTVTASLLALSAAQAHEGDSGPGHRNPGMARMHELHMQCNPGMQRMHELHMQDRDGMHGMGMHRHGR